MFKETTQKNNQKNNIKKLSLGLIAGATIFVGGVFFSNNTYAAQLFGASSWNTAKVVYHGEIAVVSRIFRKFIFDRSVAGH